MRGITIITFLFLFLESFSTPKRISITNNLSDTSIYISFEDSLIHALYKKNSLPQSDDLIAINNYTKQGFKDLFAQFNYNTSIPYSNQVNPHAEPYMQDYLKKHSKYLYQMRSTALPYFNIIENIFKGYGLPPEMKYLAVIESGLKTNATSWVGAAGPWQFMPETGIQYGLVVNKYQDDRRDYFKSTRAAALMLLELYAKYHDWLLVIAAYNGGSGRVNHAIKKANSKSFWDLQYYLPEESRNHVKKFIATHYVMEGQTFNSKAAESKNKLTDEEIENSVVETITGKFIASILVQRLDLNIKTFERFNPNFDQTLSNAGQYALRLPFEKMELFKSTKYEILNACIQFLMNN
jgi:membrane-bound lytic murein transglycosylase D